MEKDELKYELINKIIEMSDEKFNLYLALVEFLITQEHGESESND